MPSTPERGVRIGGGTRRSVDGSGQSPASPPPHKAVEMAAERLSMRKLRELLRLRFEAKLSTRAIAANLNMGNGTVCDYLVRARAAKLPWPLPPELDDDEALAARLFPTEGKAVAERPEPDWVCIYAELKKKGVTKLLLWQEYLETHPEGYRYSRFCKRYEQWLSRVNVTMRQEHRAGEKSFVDFSGDGVEVVDAVTGEVRTAKLFVAVLGASSLTYVEPIFSEELTTWVGCHVRALEYFGGVPELVVPDNLKAGVTRAHRYEPEENPTYAELARHYAFAILPARPAKPRDKAKVESAVLVAQRWILAVLRHRRFSSLAQMSEVVRPLVKKLNTRPMRKLGKSRRELFEQVERGAFKPLPERTYELANWKKARVNIDYHVELDGHWYSVPYEYVGQKVELRYTESSVEVLLDSRRLTCHVRSSLKGRFTTLAEHKPAAHRQHAERTPSRVIQWAGKVGPSCMQWVEQLIKSRPHLQQGFRPALGIIRLGH